MATGCAVEGALKEDLSGRPSGIDDLVDDGAGGGEGVVGVVARVLGVHEHEVGTASQGAVGVAALGVVTGAFVQDDNLGVVIRDDLAEELVACEGDGSDVGGQADGHLLDVLGDGEFLLAGPGAGGGESGEGVLVGHYFEEAGVEAVADFGDLAA